MNTDFSTSYRNNYDILRFSYSRKNQANINPVTHIANDVPIDAKQVTAPPPSQTLQHIGMERHIFWDWVAKLIEIIKKLWPWAPPHVDHRLCEDFLLAYSGRELQGGTTSQVLHYLHTFLSQEKDVPPTVLKELAQAREWAQGIESAGSKWFCSGKASKLTSLASSMAQTIRALKKGESCLIPGGFYDKNGLKHALYSISFDGKDYALEILARDPQIHESALLAAAGKQKILSGTTFSPLTLAEVTDTPWLASLLSLQLLPTLDEAKEAVPANRGAFCRLLSRFATRQVDPKALKTTSYHTKRDGLTRVQNVWSFVHDQMSPDPVKKARRKLRLSLDVLFRYADSVKRDLKTSILARDHLEAGMRRLSQTALSLHTEGHLQADELEWIHSEFTAIREALQRLKTQDLPATSHEINHAEMALAWKKAPDCLPPQEYQLQKTDPVAVPTGTPQLSDLAKINFDEKISRPETPAADFSAKALVSTLQAIEKRMESEYNEDPLSLQHYLIDRVFSIPIDAYIMGDGHRYMLPDVKPNPDDRWALLTPEERVEASRILAKYAKLIEKASANTHTRLPDRLMTIIKLGLIVDHLAFLNADQTGRTANTRNYSLCHQMLSFKNPRCPYRLKEAREYIELENIDHFNQLISDRHDKSFEDYFNFLEKGEIKPSPQSQHLLEIKETLEAFKGKKIESDWVSKLNEWGRPIQDPKLAGVALNAVFIDKGISYDELAEHDIFQFTQEAIVDNPNAALQKCLRLHVDRWLKSSNSNIQKLTVDELRDLLLAMDYRLSIWSLMGLIEARPELLSNPDICSLIDMRFLDHLYVRVAVDKDRTLVPFLGSFLKKHIFSYFKKGQVEAALFLIHLNHAFKETLNAPQLEPSVHLGKDSIKYLRAHAKLMPSYENVVYNLLLEALKETTNLKQHVLTLLVEYLYLFRHKQTLTVQEMCNVVIFSFVMENRPIDPNHFDPVLIDQVRKGVLAWKPMIQKTLADHPEVCQYILGRICELMGEQQSTDLWTGIYPEYRTQNFKINFAKGFLEKLDTSGFNDQMPPHVLRHSPFAKAFPEWVEKQPKVKKALIAGGETYVFFDKEGVECRVEVIGPDISLYRKHPQRETWLKLIDPEEFEIKTSAPPRYILDLPWFIAIDRPSEVLIYDPDTKEAFRCHINAKPNQCKSVVIDDLRPGAQHRQGMSVSGLDEKDHPELTFLKNFIPEEHILLWSKDQKIQELELVGYNLCFAYQHGQFFCTSQPFKGYQLDLSAAHLKTKGIPGALPLLPPDKSLPGKVLIPTADGSYCRILPEMPHTRFQMIFLFIKVLWQKFIQGHVQIDFYDPLDQFPLVWRLTPKLKGNPYYIFQADVKTGKLVPESLDKAEESYFALFKSTLASFPILGPPALQTADEVLFDMDKLPASVFSQDFVTQALKEVRKLALHPSGLQVKQSPEALGYALRFILMLRGKTPPRCHAALDQTLGLLAPPYFESGKHINLKALLSREQIKICVQVMKTADPAYYAAHAPMLLADQDPVQYPADLSRKQFFISKRPGLDRYAQLIPPILSAFRQHNEGKTQDFYLSRDPSKVAFSFRQLYATVVNKTPADEEFKKTHMSLKALADNPAEQSYLGNLVDFMDLLFEIKAQRHGLQLPTWPTLQYPKKPKKSSETENSRIEEVYRISDKEFETFFAAVSEVMKKEYPTLAANCLDPTPVAEVERRTLERRLQEASHFIKAEQIPLDQVDAAGLEKLLASTPSTPLAEKIYQPQVADCLFTDADIKDYFEEQPDQRLIDDAPFRKLKNHTEASVRTQAQVWIKKIDNYNQAVREGKIKQRCFKDAASYEKMKAMAQAKKEALDKSLTAQKQKILGLISPPKNALSGLEVQAGYDRVITWDELYLYCLQGYDDQMSRKLGPQVDKALLNRELRDYFKLEAAAKFLAKAQDELDLVGKENLLQSPGSIEKIFDFLTRCRGFNAEAHPQLLVLEALLGIVLTEEQLNLVWDFIKDPSAIRLSKTGTGKSTVILLLTGLLKANGSNLVTLKFLDPLFHENLKRLQSLLGGVLKKRVTPMLFDMRTPLVIQKTSPEGVQRESVFKRMYESAMTTILDKGILVSNRNSLPLLEAKLIALVYKLSNMPETEAADLMEMEHVKWLSKLVFLIKNKQEELYDEHDKFLAPKEELHLRLSGHLLNPEFVWETILEIYDHLLEDPHLQLKQNTQAEGLNSKREEALKRLADQLAIQWAKKLSLNKEQQIQLQQYFKGENEEILTHLDKTSASNKEDLIKLDQIALVKDMLLMFLPLALSKAANKGYILSEDKVKVIPCEYTNKGHEGAEIEDIRERTAYTCQHYHQRGVAFEYFKSWLDQLAREAHKEIDADDKKTLNQTEAEKRFKSFFPKETLSHLFAKDYQRLHAQVNKDPKLVRKFLADLLPKLEISGKRISIDAHNKVSMSKASAGTSATGGCKKGYNRQFHHESEEGNMIDATMLARFAQRGSTAKPPLTFNPASPKDLIPELLGQDPSLRVVIDGAGALWGVEAQEAAEQLKSKANLPAVGYFDAKGTVKYAGQEQAELKDKGQVFPHDQARGAHVVLSVGLPAVLLADGRKSLEELLQNEGRLRNPDQQMRLGVPVESGLTNGGELIARSVETGALNNSEDIYRSKKQEPRDIVRREMLDNLLQHLVAERYQEAFALSRQYQPENILVVEKGSEEWRTPGKYYEKNKHIQRKNESPVKVLTELKNDYKTIAKRHNLKAAQTELNKIQYEPLAGEMPHDVYGSQAPILDREVAIETELQLQAETELSVEMDTELNEEQVVENQDEAPYYLGWRKYGMPTFKMHSYQAALHPAYDPELEFTENFLPLYRKTWAPPIHQREAHDLKQNRLHFIGFEGDHLVAYDELDALERKVDCYYDMKLRRVFSAKYPIPPLTAKQIHLIAQMRFEDGQYTGYSPEEESALFEWIKGWQDPAGLEQYFKQQVLKNRPQDKVRYPFSQLKGIFDKVLNS